MHYEYFLILGIFAVVATFLKIKFKVKLFNNLKELISYYLIILTIGIIWDNYAVANGHWYYPGKGIIGIFIGLIPIEDYLFGVICTYFVLVLYKILHKN